MSNMYAPHIQRALDALDAISADYADYAVTSDGGIEVLPYWSPECVDPDGRPIGTDKKHIRQWERVTEALEDAGFEPLPPDGHRIGVLLAIIGGRMHEGQPVVFRYVWDEE